MGQTRTFAAFELYVVFDQPAQCVADKLNIHLNSVYRAKEQITRLLQERCGHEGRGLIYAGAMPQISAGFLMYRRAPDGLQVLLVHLGGPFWKNKDAGAWTIPKGLSMPAKICSTPPSASSRKRPDSMPPAEFLPLSAIKQRAGKLVHAWAVEGDVDPAKVKSTVFRSSGRPSRGTGSPSGSRSRRVLRSEAGARKINPAQAALIDELEQKLKA